jgi:maleylpyruvate isomerase
MEPTSEIEEARRAHRRLLDGVARIHEEGLGEASRLPGFTRAHVIAHLTNKARAHRRLFIGPQSGEVRRLHPEAYDPDVAAQRPAGTTGNELRTELAESLLELEAAWDALDDGMWEQEGLVMAGPRTMAEIVGHHLRNIEVHHVDLDIGYEPGDWSSVFVEGELNRRLAGLPARAGHPELLAWLLERGPAPELEPW